MEARRIKTESSKCTSSKSTGRLQETRISFDFVGSFGNIVGLRDDELLLMEEIESDEFPRFAFVQLPPGC